jgi:DNA-binding IclR family transcriptional regulator
MMKHLLVAAGLILTAASPAAARDHITGRLDCKPLAADAASRVPQTRREAARIASQEACVNAHFRKQHS